MEQPITLSPLIRQVIDSTECYRCGQTFERSPASSARSRRKDTRTPRC